MAPIVCGACLAWLGMFIQQKLNWNTEKRKRDAQYHKDQADRLANLIGALAEFQYRVVQAARSYRSFKRHPNNNTKDPYREELRQDAKDTLVAANIASAKVTSCAEMCTLPQGISWPSPFLADYTSAWLNLIFHIATDVDRDVALISGSVRLLVADLRWMIERENSLAEAILKSQKAPAIGEPDLYILSAVEITRVTANLRHALDVDREDRKLASCIPIIDVAKEEKRLGRRIVHTEEKF